jgi:hypothetical protein
LVSLLPLAAVVPVVEQAELPLAAVVPVVEQAELPLAAAVPVVEQGELPLAAVVPVVEQGELPLAAAVVEQGELPLAAVVPVEQGELLPVEVQPVLAQVCQVSRAIEVLANLSRLAVPASQVARQGSPAEPICFAAAEVESQQPASR